jgi:hypothetical protein
MQREFHARRVSKPRADILKKEGRLGKAMLLDIPHGFIIIEPMGSNLGDGEVLSAQEANAELQLPWYTGPQTKLREARAKLGLERPPDQFPRKAPKHN